MSPGAPATTVDRDAFPYRMKDLCDRTGLPRQAIHFYIQAGLLPEGQKTGRNMAYYGDEHLERIRLIRKLQHERFLPLKAIKAMLDGRDDAFTPAQRRVLAGVRARLARARPPEPVDAKALLVRHGLTRLDLEEAAEVGFLGVFADESGRLLVAADDAWMFELLGELRAIGFTRELGFNASVLGIFEDALDTLFQREARALLERLAHLPPEEVAAMIERAVPLINTFLVRLHETKLRNFLAGAAT
jgi:DNA-binding transcriptional MerR regulator